MRLKLWLVSPLCSAGARRLRSSPLRFIIARSRIATTERAVDQLEVLFCLSLLSHTQAVCYCCWLVRFATSVIDLFVSPSIATRLSTPSTPTPLPAWSSRTWYSCSFAQRLAYIGPSSGLRVLWCDHQQPRVFLGARFLHHHAFRSNTLAIEASLFCRPLLDCWHTR